ncbi:putative aldehyde oxidase 4 [Triticum urartu]|uniref:Putative aldehyde oxidase 4 n=1 Tax=Triticum urartu TaxID=4572 RepID=M7ZA77_TRIUA|nr:putative aldehyde oxidase 4 [Triticum urartu]
MRLERLVFVLNGRRHEVAASDVHPGTTLLEFIRTRTPFTGTKLGCGEGGGSPGRMHGGGGTGRRQREAAARCF